MGISKSAGLEGGGGSGLFELGGVAVAGPLEEGVFELSRWGQGAIGATRRIDHWDQEQEGRV